MPVSSADRAAAIVAMAFLVLGCEREEYCTNTCRFARDMQCDEGTSATGTGYCARGTDCQDCGPNENVEPGFQLDGVPEGEPFEYHDAPGEAPPGLTLSETCGEGAREACGPAGAGLGDAVWYTADGCRWGWYTCPYSHFEDPNPYRYECRLDGSYGAGCYLEGVDPGVTEWQRCTRMGSCTCQDGTRYEQEIELCHQRPIFYGRDHVASCTTWYQVQDQRHECGTFQCSPNGAPPACDLEIAVAERLCGCGELPPPPPPSATCASIVESTRSEYERLRTDPCRSGCIDDYIDCLIRTDCRDVEACIDSYSDCLGRCS